MSEEGPGSDREVRVHVFGRTDVGQIREHNEDNFLVADLTRRTRSLREEDRHQVVGPCGTLLGVCDGTLTARAALTAIAQLLEADEAATVGSALPILRALVADGLLVP